MDRYTNGMMESSPEDNILADIGLVLKALLDEQTNELKTFVAGNKKEESNNEMSTLRLSVQQLQEKCNNLETELQNEKLCRDTVLIECENERKKVELLTIEKEDFVKSLGVAKAELEQKSEEEYRLKKAYDSMRIMAEKYSMYSEIDAVYEKFLELDSETVERLKNIYPLKNMYTFLSASMQWENIKGLYDFLKTKVVEGKLKDFEKLREIFLVIFKIYNQQGVEPIYKLISPDVGSFYNSDEQSILGKKTDGVIQEVVLEGIKTVRTNKVLFTALVLV